MTDKTTIAKATVAIFSAWNRDCAQGTFLAFEYALRDLTEEQVSRGVERAIHAGGPHPPSAGDVRALALGKSDADLRALAHEAYKRADELARTVGHCADVRNELDDPLATHAIGSLGGWPHFCQHINEWQERTFVNAYVEAAKNPALEQVATLSHKGQPLGALQQERKQLAERISLARVIPLEHRRR